LKTSEENIEDLKKDKSLLNNENKKLEDETKAMKIEISKNKEMINSLTIR
jgi:hypothetical protein